MNRLFNAVGSICADLSGRILDATTHIVRHMHRRRLLDRRRELKAQIGGFEGSLAHLERKLQRMEARLKQLGHVFVESKEGL